MKKLFLLFLIISLSVQLWGVSAKPGSGHTHDGSIRPGMTGNSYSPSLSSDGGVRRASALSKASVSTTGSKKILVILAPFKDYGFNETIPGTSDSGAVSASTHDETYYKKLLETGSGLTMKKYYDQQSRGALDLSFKVIKSGVKSIESYEYYGQNDVYDDDTHPAVLVREMMVNVITESVAAEVDNCVVIVVHAGPGEEEGGVSENLIWSHRSTLTSQSISSFTIGGKTFNDYLIVPEYNMWHGVYEATVGVFCHEFGHVLGLPDLYDTSYKTAGVGMWSLMGGGEWGTMGAAGVSPGTDPAPFMNWERAYLGWITETDITPASGKSVSYDFEEANDSDTVYRINLSDDQYLTLEGKKKNKSGSGMLVEETGLLITQIHKGILNNYWSTNTVNYGTYRPHGAMVVEAVASNYKSNGLGNLWRGSSSTLRTTTTALFRSGTLTSVGPVASSSSADLPFLPLFTSTMIGSGIVICILGLWYAGRKKLCAVIAIGAFAACFSLSCSIFSGGSGTYDSGPNTNYYTTMNNVHSKTGISGITIYNIQVNEDGSGSFRVKKD